MNDRRLLYWQIATVTLMVLGYSGYYLCRSHLSVTTPLLLDWLAERGMSKSDAKTQIGQIVSWGTLAYAFGKFFGGGIADFAGGRRNFLGGMFGAVLFTVAFALGGGLPIFTLAWVMNRTVQSFGWPGLVKVSSKWFPFRTYGTVMGVLSLSFLFGDAASRAFMGWLIKQGLTWQQVFYTCAGTLFIIFLANLFLLQETPQRLGLPEPEANPENVFGEEGERPAPPSLMELLRPFLRSPAFWIVCLLSLGFTLVRETFNTWTPTYFQEFVGMTKDAAAAQSAYFPLVGGFSVILTGYLGDRLGRTGRSLIILVGLLFTTAALFGLAQISPAASKALPVWIVSLVAFVMIGPYSYLAGAIALDFGGKQGSGAASGVIDGVGYLGGVLAGKSIAEISVQYGWSGAFLFLAGVAAFSCIAASGYLLLQRRSLKS